MYRAPNDYEQLKKAVFDFVAGQKGFYSERDPAVSSLSKPRQLLAGPDRPSGQTKQ